MALHALQTLEQLPACVAALTRDDALLLIGEAVYLLATQGIISSSLPCTLYALESDVQLADITVHKDICHIVDYTDWVALTELHPQYVQWGSGQSNNIGTDIALNGMLIGRCNERGFLADWQGWDRNTANAFAKLENITLTDAHWEIINLLRMYYADFGTPPANRALVNFVKKKLGQKKGNSIYLLSLFPTSPARVASRIAGLPKPKNCL